MQRVDKWSKEDTKNVFRIVFDLPIGTRVKIKHPWKFFRVKGTIVNKVKHPAFPMQYWVKYDKPLVLCKTKECISTTYGDYYVLKDIVILE